MNQRILELTDRVAQEVPGTHMNIPDEFCTKFAELIVAKVLDEVATRAYVCGDRSWSDDLDRPWIELEFGYGKLAEMKK
jgi:hypothetical protein